jgi:hypothetical protein
MVHLRLQSINDLNFHEFGGSARDESDYVADNLANILLLRAYGQLIYVKGKISYEKQARFQRIFEMNRCNRVFAERAIQRKEEITEFGRFSERIWRFKRQIANTISAQLLSRGAGVADVAIYFSGESIERDESRGGYYHSGNVIIRLNQIYYNSGCPPYLEDASAECLPKERVNVIRSNYSARVEEIVRLSVTRYMNRLKEDAGLRSYASSLLNGIEDRILFW